MRLWNRKETGSSVSGAGTARWFLPGQTGASRQRRYKRGYQKMSGRNCPREAPGLEGRSVLISIYINDKGSKWTKKQKRKQTEKSVPRQLISANRQKNMERQFPLVADTEKI